MQAFGARQPPRESRGSTAPLRTRRFHEACELMLRAYNADVGGAAIG